MDELIKFIEQAQTQWTVEAAKSARSSTMQEGAAQAATAILAKAKELAQKKANESSEVPKAKAKGRPASSQ